MGYFENSSALVLHTTLQQPTEYKPHHVLVRVFGKFTERYCVQYNQIQILTTVY